MANKLLTIGITTYDNSQYINQLLNIINHQIKIDQNLLNLVDFSLYDDLSSDSSFLNKLPTYFNVYQAKVNSGSPSVGRNHIINQANSQYILFIDGDDMLLSNINLILDKLLNNQHDLIVTPVKMINSNTIMPSPFLYNDKLFNSNSSQDLIEKICVHQTGIWSIYKLSFLKEHNIQYRADIRYEDNYFLYSILLNNPQIQALNLNYYGWRQHQQSFSNSSFSFDSRVELFKETLKLLKLHPEHKLSPYILFSIYNQTYSNLLINHFKLSNKEIKLNYHKLKELEKNNQKLIKGLKARSNKQVTAFYFDKTKDNIFNNYSFFKLFKLYKQVKENKSKIDLFLLKVVIYFPHNKREKKSNKKSLYNQDRYINLYSDGFLKHFKYFNKLPKFLKEAIIYQIEWNLKELKESKLILKPEQRLKRELDLQVLFKQIDFSYIASHPQCFNDTYQIGINNKYYNLKNDLKAKITYVQETEFYYKFLLIDSDDIYNENQVANINSNISDDLNNNQVNNWDIYLDDVKYQVSDLDNRFKQINLNHKAFVNYRYIKIEKKYQSIIIEHNKINQLIPFNYEYQDKEFNQASSIILFDRENKADDNAEVFYNWMKANHPQYNNIYYAIRKESSDYIRLKKEGFKLVDYGSKEFDKLYLNSDFIISSGLDESLISDYKKLRLTTKSKAKFIFLQHGVITDDLSELLRNKLIDKIIVTANIEYDNLVNKYHFFKEEVMLTGLPRFDKLYDNSKKEILLQLTWRNLYHNYNSSEINKTNYIQKIKRILSDPTLINKLKSSGYIIKYIAHPQMNQHLDLFKSYDNENIEILNVNNISYRDQFAAAKLLVTDYSSVFADFSYLKKPVIYYQDDLDDFYRSHTYGQEINYQKGGLGPVTQNHQDLINQIIEYIDNECQVEDKYIKRIDKFFKYNDQNNCQRLYDRLKEDY